MVIRRIEEYENNDALELVLKVFMEYEAPDYTTEGVETFKKTAVYNRDYIDSIKMYGAYLDEKIVGTIATRNNGNHIALFFVDGEFHRKGIGKLLFQTVLEQSTTNEITVNSSPYAQEVYHHLGFEDTALEQTSDGIRYIPMVYKKEAGAYKKIIEILNEVEIDYKVHTHKDIATVEEAKKTVEFDINKCIKTLAFEYEDRLIFVALLAEDKINYSNLCSGLKLKRSNLKRANSKILEDEYGYEPGGIAPISVSDHITVIFDSKVGKSDIIFCGSGKRNTTIEIKVSDIMKLNRCTFLDITEV